MSSHKRFVEMLARRPELSESEGHTLGQHLAQCEECRGVAVDYEGQSAALRTLPLVSSPSSLRPSVLIAIRQAPPQRRGWIMRPALLLAPLLVASLVIVVALAHSKQRGTQTSVSRPSSHPSPLQVTPKGPATPVTTFRKKPQRIQTRSHQTVKSRPKSVLQSAPSAVAQNLQPPISRPPPLNSTLGSGLNDTAHSARTYQNSAKKAYGGSLARPDKPSTANATPVNTPLPQPTSAAVIRAGPAQTVAQPKPPVRISTPIPQPTPAPGAPKATPGAPPNL